MKPSFRIEGFIGEGTATAAEVATFLADNPGPVQIVVNSPGGVASEGAAIFAELERRAGVEVLVEGIAASAASLAAVGGAEIVMHSAAMMMIHEPSGMTFGPAAQHRKSVETLEQLTAVYAAAYARATGNSTANLRRWMAEETWLSAEEALALNFCDRIEAGERRAPEPVAFDYSIFREPPFELLELTRLHGWGGKAKKPASSGVKTDA